VTEAAPSPTSTSFDDPTALAALLGRMGAVLLSTETIGTTVELVTSLAKATIPGTTGAGVTLVDDQGKRSVAASDRDVERADALQYELDAGPCLTSFREQVRVRIDDVLEDDRWPAWTAAVAEVGVRAMLSVPLVAAGTCIGAIKVYSSTPAAFDDRAEHLLGLFAQQAAILLANTQTVAEARRTNVQLTEALQTRDLIARAKGILLERGAVDDAAAFAVLVTAAQQSNTKLSVVARQLVESVTRRSVSRRSE
jgi:GAF domain-containing protein